jgi:DNA-binding transcriptional MerR regulator
MSTARFFIGDLARETGCKIPTIRYYERIGLLPAPGRTAGNTRRYGPAHRARLAFIRHCRSLGFSQPAIRELLELTDHPNQSCETVARIAKAQLTEVDQRMARLTALRSELERMIAACDGGRVEQCRIIEALADYPHAGCAVSE